MSRCVSVIEVNLQRTGQEPFPRQDYEPGYTRHEHGMVWGGVGSVKVQRNIPVTC